MRKPVKESILTVTAAFNMDIGAVRIIVGAMVIYLVIWSGIFLLMINRIEKLEEKIKSYENLMQNENKTYDKMKNIMQYYKMMIQEDDLK